MRDDDCVRFLQWALPRLGMRWPGFRKVRRQVCRRIVRRMGELGLRSLREYRERLEGEPGEWRALDRLCRVTISRFWRDRETFRALEETVLPAVAGAALEAGSATLDAWSCGCASGEEAYTLSILWHERLRPRFSGLRLRILATDLDLHLLQRAGRAVYPEGAVRELPEELARAGLEAVPSPVRALGGGPAGSRTGAPGGAASEVGRRRRAGAPTDDLFRIPDRYRAPVHRVLHDVRSDPPAGPFHLILCRNLAFTYFDERLQRAVAHRLARALHPGGALVLGNHEEVPDGVEGLVPWLPGASIYRRNDSEVGGS